MPYPAFLMSSSILSGSLSRNLEFIFAKIFFDLSLKYFTFSFVDDSHFLVDSLSKDIFNTRE